jgi:hypothetical protein
MTAGVHDGVKVRHLCCSVHDCKRLLPTQKYLFCDEHKHYIKICCIIGCDDSVEPGFRTCPLLEHRAFEKTTDERNSAMFQLHARLRNTGVSQVQPAGSDVSVKFGNWTLSYLCLQPTSSQTPNREVDTDLQTSTSTSIKGKLSRSWTHNEQLFVRCCGVIISRATFFGSEGIYSAKVRFARTSFAFNLHLPVYRNQEFLKATFPPEYPGSLPSYIFYDNNCQFLKHLHAIGDTYFDEVGLPVDVFHFKCKHTIRDGFCQVNCNPARFLELIGENNKWVFNSSAAEQANV